jgi:hypothetical protein
MSDTGLSSIPGKVCSIPIYRSKGTTVRFFIHSCTSCCSITTPRRPAGELKVLKLQKGQQLKVRVKNLKPGKGGDKRLLNLLQV